MLWGMSGSLLGIDAFWALSVGFRFGSRSAKCGHATMRLRCALPLSSVAGECVKRQEEESEG